MDKKKTLGQVFTPLDVVKRMLDCIDYKGHKTLTHRILEPSCGEAVFLIEAATRLIEYAQSQDLPAPEISALLRSNLTGMEYDPEVLEVSRDNLDTLARQYSLPPVEWDLVHVDALRYSPEEAYDYVVGNPPYIRVHNMDAALREQVKKFSSSTGTTDLYIIFYELGLRWLKENGTLAYITPNSWFKNVSQKSFRESLVTKRQIREIINYGTRPVFGTDASTYTSIIVLDKAGGNESIGYTEDSSNQWTNKFPYEELECNPGKPFVFAKPADVTFLADISSRGTAIGSQCNIQNGAATLRDKIFLSAPANSEDEITLPVIKASTYKGTPLLGRIIFPYANKDGTLIPLSEDKLMKYPHAYQHLLTHKEELLTRDRDKSALWFHYGRSQGINNMLKPKLTFSHVVHPDQSSIKCFALEANSVVYSGLFITAIDAGVALSEIKAIIESADFCAYIKLVGKDMSGGYKSFGVKDINAFRFDH